MEKYLLDDNGSPILDENGKNVLNPEWLAANPDYTLAVDESGISSGGYTPDAATQAWHDAKVAGLKRAQSKALQSNAKNRKRADVAEARVKELESELETARANGGGDEASIQARIDTEVKNRIRVMETERDEARSQVSTLKSELSQYRYEGRIERGALGVVHPDHKYAAMATLKSLIKEDANGEITCYDTDGNIAMNNQGDPLEIEDFIHNVFRKSFPSLCQTDTGAPAHGNNGAITAPKSNNPFAKDSLNRTHQSQLIKNDPAKAREFMKQAGYEPKKIQRMLAA